MQEKPSDEFLERTQHPIQRRRIGSSRPQLLQRREIHMDMHTSCCLGVKNSRGWGCRFFEPFSREGSFHCYHFFWGRRFHGKSGRIPRVNTKLNGHSSRAIYQ
ncbi:Bgt-20641 [Blumeria graminis f. sp. tritici]|uniref:Bgt-20641 n=2 Tax=Blumeria graminis f. sp. tritici TaxID=62690 RepID=A0A9X9QFV3_BLUGR|nr:Bgt-20641 [Blumeria graminis f. sp. tritici]